MPTQVSVHTKEPAKDHLNELMILDLTVAYSTVWHSTTDNATRFDMHLKRDEAKALYKALEEELGKNQVVSPSVDR